MGPYGYRYRSGCGFTEVILVIILMILLAILCRQPQTGGSTDGQPYRPGLLEPMCGNNYVIDGTSVTNAAWCDWRGSFWGGKKGATEVMCVIAGGAERHFKGAKSLTQTRQQQGPCVNGVEQRK